jgi:hypothetical protein
MLDEPLFDSQQAKEMFLFSKMSKLILVPTQPPIQWVPWFYLRGKAAGA